MNPHRRRISAAAAAVLATGFVFPRPAFAEDQLDRILRRGLLRAAVPRDFPPFGTTRRGYPEGLDVSMVRLLGIELKVPVALEAVQSADRIPYLPEAVPDIALRDGTLCRHVLKESPCRIGVRKGEQHLLARIERFVDDAGPLALTVNAMLWFKTTFPTGFYQHPIGPT